MKPCPRCSAHVHVGDDCPFCAAPSRPSFGPTLAAALLGLALVGCPKGKEAPGPEPVVQPEYGVAVPIELEE